MLHALVHQLSAAVYGLWLKQCKIKKNQTQNHIQAICKLQIFLDTGKNVEACSGNEPVPLTPRVSRLQTLTLESKHDVPPLEVDIFIWLLPLSNSLSPRPTAEDGRLCEDVAGRLPEVERFLVSDELPPAPPFSFWYSMGD